MHINISYFVELGIEQLVLNWIIDFLVMWDYRFWDIAMGLLRQLINLEIMSKGTLFNQCITFWNPGWQDGSLVSFLLCTQMTPDQILAFPDKKNVWSFFGFWCNVCVATALFNGIVISWSFYLKCNNCNQLLRKYRLYMATTGAPLRGTNL